ncbi:glycosyl hydrolase 25 family protein [Mesorhizobium sp. B2-4-2]|uniref:glycoside hydrolase family 25 protein n=1 Tax=unclassified Mesorhizobium TaxID=325217 RepID=UPI00112B5D20|nr:MULTISPECIES: glycoside hydrolase family 25 protein [unclassified Mesorhizobium]MCA0056165.1 glycoside hydrolase family 25 protein [Mesorhizobium sp. B261B1A]TPL13942.1 glycosyl hydrolase 25 family protein [Mesorhizobium sp. B2-4-11]TPL23067.1 glycosyl hydrolase 25 family protein [Mesorhizobium sp. B2-4-10]TPL61926.1 glycosyl hydrolase 25 family protein [Mesorhizobium sp. B2-4-2]
MMALTTAARASDFSEPWKSADRALVVDAYEYNSIDWAQLATDKRVVGFINKASDGMSPPYSCSGDDTEVKLCKALWKRHAVTRELFQTRKVVAKALGLKWGAYHLARPGNPVEQANNFLDFADPAPDDLMALDIEGIDPAQWMSLDDAEAFVRQVHRRIGRFPVLYTNGKTAQYIADNSYKYRLLSRLPLWYARYKPDIDVHFPIGNWQGYALWQFSAQANCGRFRCPYRVAGTPDDIDVNVAPTDAATLRQQWPFGGVIDVPADYLASVPVPLSREAALAGKTTLIYADVATPPSFGEMVAVLGSRWSKFRDGFRMPVVKTVPRRPIFGIVQYVSWKRTGQRTPAQLDAAFAAAADPVSTASTEPDRGKR